MCRALYFATDLLSIARKTQRALFGVVCACQPVWDGPACWFAGLRWRRVLFATVRVGRSGEPRRTRTCDPLVKGQLRYRLSYRSPLSQIIRT